MKYRFFFFICFVSSLFCLNSCTMTRYLFQAGHGQMSLLNNREPIAKVLQDNKTKESVKKYLREVDSIKSFARKNTLITKENYTDYVQLDRPYVVWLVSASKPYKFEAKVWSFPIVGSFNYLGWYNKESALDFAKQLRKEGWETYTRGVSAYSTLGWFRDPIVSSMLPDNEKEIGLLANTLLHELVHVTFYIENQSYFNESLANFIANDLTPHYLKERYSENLTPLNWYEKHKKRVKIFGKRFHETYELLNKVYKEIEAIEKTGKFTPRRKILMASKEKILSELKKELKLKGEINNAFLVQYKTYNQDMSAFEEVFRSCDKNVSFFIEAMKKLKGDDFEQKQQKDFKLLFKNLRCDKNKGLKS